MFDPRTFLSIAERCLEDDADGDDVDEALQRSAISRAYYAAFLVAREYLHVHGLLARPPVGKRWGSHERVIFSIGMMHHPGVRNVRKALFRLKKQRTSADYELDAVVNKARVIKAKQDSEMVIDWIDGLP